MKISLITPSRGRIPQLVAYLKRFWDTTQGYDTESIVIADGCFETIQAAKATGATVLYRPIRQGAINGWNDGLRIAKGDMIVFGANDLVWGDGWLPAAMRAMGGLPNHSGMVGFNDLSEWQDKNSMATHFMLSRECIRDVMGGCLAIPVYEHYYVDVEMNMRAQRAGCGVIAENSIVEHRSFLNGKSVDDECYAGARESFKRDAELYKVRHKWGFVNDFEPIIK